MNKTLRVVIIKPSKYNPDGYVARFRWGFLPNSTGRFILSMIPPRLNGRTVETEYYDEAVYVPSEYQNRLHAEKGVTTLAMFVGVQSHQFQRAQDLAAYAVDHGCLAIVGGPHPMTCDTTMLQNRGISFALSEAEMIISEILTDAVVGELKPVYGGDRRWATEVEAPVIIPPTQHELGRYVFPMMGIYPARGCPFLCNFCSVIKIAGRRVRSQPIETTLKTLRLAKQAGVRLVMFTSDNLNKYAEAPELMQAMIDDKIGMKFLCQTDTQIERQPELLQLMAKAGCYHIFVGVESFNKRDLKGVHKGQNRPDTYIRIVELCREFGITSHFSNIIGFPDQDEQSIKEHMKVLRSVGPNSASFYVLTPIPGTEQYGEFMAQGLLEEKNLDRYDTTHRVWAHPNFKPGELERLLYWCYRDFYRLGQIAHHAWQRDRNSPTPITDTLGTVGSGIFHWASGALHRHPMSGGVIIRNRDNFREFLPYRRKYFGDVLENDLFPLPGNLTLSSHDEEINRKVNFVELRAKVS